MQPDTAGPAVHYVEDLSRLLGNVMITSPALAWIAAQVMKTVIDALRHRRINVRLLVGPGGMPSAHSALVSGLATAAAFSEGVGSPVFAITAALAAIVMYDAAGVRKAVDRQSAILSHILTHVPRTQDDFDRFLEELVGHTRVQVAAGALLGIAVATLIR